MTAVERFLIISFPPNFLIIEIDKCDDIENTNKLYNIKSKGRLSCNGLGVKEPSEIKLPFANMYYIDLSGKKSKFESY